jgi:NADPH:quinone reductase-like Zn-dependent oxidoreductase
MGIPDIMKAVVLTGHGGPDKLEYRTDVPVPGLAAGEVLIRVGAAGVNNTDINTRTGWYSKASGKAEKTDDASWSGSAIPFPRIQGADICGEIVRVSKGIDPSRIGERVLIEPCLRENPDQHDYLCSYVGSECDGGFAEYMKIAATFAHKIQSDLSDVELASFPCAYSTAENMLGRSGVSKDERVLITGASGGVGSAAVQLAKRRGAKIIAIASASKAHKVMQLGAGNVIPRGSGPVAALGPASIDVVIDVVGGPQWPELLEVLVAGGRYAIAGAIGGASVNLDLRTLYLKDLNFFGCTALAPTVFENLVGYIERREIRPLVVETFPLSDICHAQEVFLSKKHTGKLVLIPPR